MFKKLGYLVVVGIVAFLTFVGMKSPEYMVTRSIVIQSSPEKIFPYLNNAKLTQAWGPWAESDPEAKMTYSGPEEGVGARTDWNGGEKMGQLGTGSATITASVPNEKVEIRIEYAKPMTMTQTSVYSIQAAENQSKVTWMVTGHNNGFMERMMCVFVDMDTIVGGMFEKGLTNLKALVEKES